MSAPAEEASATRSDAVPFTAALRPGVVFPDWSTVTTTSARQALAAILSAFDLERRWGGYGAEEDRVRRGVIEGLAELGDAPDVNWLAARTGIGTAQVGDVVERLVSRDLVVRDRQSGAITGAYPLATWPTGHRVTLGTRSVDATCAIDALGIGAMLHSDSVIVSRCRACGAAVALTTRSQGTALDRVEPPTTVVWSGIRREHACAATSLCTVMAFFCSDGHLDQWRSQHPTETGLRLAPVDALQVGRALFGPVLKPARLSKEDLA